MLAAEPKGQEIITWKTFLAKVTLIENYINHLEGKKVSSDAICLWDNIHFSFCLGFLKVSLTFGERNTLKINNAFNSDFNHLQKKRWLLAISC